MSADIELMDVGSLHPAVSSQDKLTFDLLMRRLKEGGGDGGLGNRELPIHDSMDAIFALLDKNQILILSGPTGSGKSTQLPQEALSRGYSSVTETQTRRIAAREVSERIGEELAGSLGNEAVGLAGYHTGERRSITDQTQVSVLTAGVHLIQTLHERQRDDSNDRKVLIIDEVHLWEEEVEVILAMINQTVIEHPNTKIIIQSATVNVAEVAKFIVRVCGVVPATIEIPGRQFPIETIEEPQSTVVEQVIKYAQLVDDGILVFLPGEGEIKDVMDELYRKLPKSLLETATILPLYSKLSTQRQEDAMLIYDGIKIILSTNVAQEAITIPGVSVVIDSGLERRIEIDEEGAPALLLRPTSRASLIQRGGRGGRLGPGIDVVTCLDSDTEFVKFEDRAEFDPPKILNSDLDRMVLRLAAGGKDMASYQFFHQPKELVFKRSKTRLIELGALDDKGMITKQGLRMDIFPVIPSSGRMMVEADKYSSKIRAYMSAIVGCVGAGGLPQYSSDIKEDWQNLTPEEISKSDLLAYLASFITAQEMTATELNDDGMDVRNLMRAREIYLKTAKHSKVPIETLVEPTGQEIEIIKKCIYAGMANSLYDHIGDGNFVPATKTGSTPRELSNRSVVSWNNRSSDNPSLIVGVPRNIELRNGTLKNIVERITVVDDPAVFESVAMDLCEWVDGKLLWRDGRATREQELKMGSVALGSRREVLATPSRGLRKEIIKAVMEKPGPAQQELRAIKKELERLNHLAKGPVPQLRQEMLERLVDASTPKDATDLSQTDNNLRLMIIEEGMNLDRFISLPERQAIIDNAPDSIELGNSGVTLKLRYSNGDAVAHGYDTEQVIGLGFEPRLSDGRMIKFRYNHQILTIRALAELITKEQFNR